MGCPAKRWIGREGNGAEGRLWLNEIMGFFCVCCASNSGEMKEWFGFLCMGLCLVSGKNYGFAVVDFSQGSTVAKRRNGLVFCVWVSVWFLAKILGLMWLIFPRGLGLLYGLPSHGFGFTQSMRAWVAVKLTR